MEFSVVWTLCVQSLKHTSSGSCPFPEVFEPHGASNPEQWRRSPPCPQLPQQAVVCRRALLPVLLQGHDVEVAVSQLLQQGQVPGGLGGEGQHEALGEAALAQGLLAPALPHAVDEGQGEGEAVVLLLLVPGETAPAITATPGAVLTRRALQNSPPSHCLNRFCSSQTRLPSLDSEHERWQKWVPICYPCLAFTLLTSALAPIPNSSQQPELTVCSFKILLSPYSTTLQWVKSYQSNQN